MLQTQLINQVVEWERGLEIEEERRKSHRNEPYTNYLAKVQSDRQARSIFAWIIEMLRGHRRECQPASPCFSTEQRPKTLPG